MPFFSLHWALTWKKSYNALLLCFESYQGISYFHTDRVDKRMVKTLSLVIIKIAYERSLESISLEDKSMLFNHFYLSEKNPRNLARISSKDARYVFFIGVAIKLAILLSWCTTPVLLCWPSEPPRCILVPWYPSNEIQ